MKKALFILIILIILISLSSRVNAQEGPENIVYLNLGYTIAPLLTGLTLGGWGIGLGADFERYITDYFTIGGTLGFAYSTFSILDSNMDLFFIDVIPEWRYYPLGTATRGFFLAART